MQVLTVAKSSTASLSQFFRQIPLSTPTMKGSTCLLSSTTALGRAVAGSVPQRPSLFSCCSSSSSFSTLTASTSSRSRSMAYSIPPFLAPSLARRTPPSHSTNTSTPTPSWTQCRSLHASGPLRRRAPPGKSGAGGDANNKRLPRDHEITHEYVVLRLEDGSISEPQPTAAVLLRLKLGVESLAVVAMPAASSSSTGNAERDTRQPQYPICRIVNVEEERRMEQERAREQRKKATMFKELEFNWSINAHDLGHWMIKLQDFLEKGFRVEIRLMKRTRGKARRQASMDEARELVRRIKEAAEGVPGTKEVRPMEGELLKSVKMVYEGPAVKKEKRKKRKGGEEDEDAEEQDDSEEVPTTAQVGNEEVPATAPVGST